MNAATLGTIEEFDAQFDAENPPAVDHVTCVVNAACKFVAISFKWLNDPHRVEYLNHPPERILTALAELFATFAQQHAEWPRHSWPLLIQLRSMATDILPLAPSWFTSFADWPERLFSSDGLDKALRTYMEPPLPPEPRVAAMEPIADLVKLGVRREQIARMADWYTTPEPEQMLPNGLVVAAKPRRLDIERVQRAIDGTEPWPRVIELEPTSDGLPDSPPLLGIVFDVGQLAAAALASA